MPLKTTISFSSVLSGWRGGARGEVYNPDKRTIESSLRAWRGIIQRYARRAEEVRRDRAGRKGELGVRIDANLHTSVHHTSKQKVDKASVVGRSSPSGETHGRIDRGMCSYWDDSHAVVVGAGLSRHAGTIARIGESHGIERDFRPLTFLVCPWCCVSR